MKNYTICLIHNTHTDVGFTGTQEEIELQQYDFLVQVINILESGNYPAFAWQCENTWQIDNFYDFASEDEKHLLEKWIRLGKIGLSGTYLNMTELSDAQTLDYWACHAREYAKTLGVNSACAMSCDVNGYGWAFADVLSKNGYGYFFASIHTHHGMFPTNRCPSCFRWIGPDGGSVLAFISEHYNLGNELGLCPNSMLSYTIHDKYSKALDSSMLRTDRKITENEELEVAEYRIIRYLEGLEESGYPFEYVPVLASGAYTDNGAPNPAICERVDKLNRIFNDRIHIEITLLDDFFQKIDTPNTKIPTIKGDLPDWWASGTGTDANSVRLYRQAQRNLRLIDKLDKENKYHSADMRRQAMKKAILFAEHTWSYCATVFNPWSIQNKAVELKNKAYAADFHSITETALLRIKRTLGNRAPYVQRKPTWMVINPNHEKRVYPITLSIDSWEYIDGCKFEPQKYELRDDKTGCVIASQIKATSRGPAYETLIELAADEKRKIILAKKNESDNLIDHNAAISTDGIYDIASGENTISPAQIETPCFSIKVKRGEGIVSIYDKTANRELLSNNGISAFACVRDVTPVSEDSGLARKLTRRSMGRNQASFSTKREFATLSNAVITENGSVYAMLELTYQLEGLERNIVRLKIYKQQPIISASIIVTAYGGLSPESLYIALPFDRTPETYIAKAGCCLMRPGIDQLPASCQAFYAVQDGVICQKEDRDVLIVINDIPLVLCGLPEPEPVTLSNGTGDVLAQKPLFAWALNNYWETNFPCNIAGDYEFSITIMSENHKTAHEQLSKIKDFAEGCVVLDL